MALSGTIQVSVVSDFSYFLTIYKIISFLTFLLTFVKLKHTTLLVTNGLYVPL